MKRVILLLTFAFASIASYAEKPDDEKVKTSIEKKATFVIEKMDLTPEEAEKFVPIYKKYITERYYTFEESPFNDFDYKAKSKMTEEEYKKINDNFVNGRVNRALATKWYYEMFREIIPESKIYKMQMAERDFKFELLKLVQNKGANSDRTTTTNK